MATSNGHGRSVSGFQSQLERDADEAERSRLFRVELDRLRSDAQTPHPRALRRGSIAAYSLLELSRPGAIRTTSWGPASLEFVDRYVSRCKRVARRFFRAEAAALLVHELAQQDSGYRIRAGSVGPRAQDGPLASTLAADVHGIASFHNGGATSMREQRYQFSRHLRSAGYERDVLTFALDFTFARRADI